MGLFGKPYDVFLSYKSKNVGIARAMADRLIASGRKVWFAEYQVLLTDRHRFQEAIDRGIRRSKYGLALTNNAYAGSAYCAAEMLQLLEFCGPKNVLEIKIPDEPETHRKYPRLSESPAHLFTGRVDDVLAFVAGHTGWKVAPQISMPTASRREIFEGACLGQAFRVDVTGWELVEKSFRGGGPCYVRTVEGDDIFWNLQYGEETDPAIYEARLSLNQDDERALYNEICAYAHHYFRDLKPGSRVTGAHLLLIRGRAHFAVTYYDGRFWKRRASLMLVHPASKQAAEFLFTFQFPGPFRRYCRCAALMDDLVGTLEWGGGRERSGQAAPEPPAAEPSRRDDRLHRIIEDQPRANALYHEGLSLAKQGRLKEALASWENVLTHTMLPELRGATLFNIGRAHEKMGDIRAALRSYERSVEAHPGQFNALCNMGSLYLRQGKPREALKPLLEAARLNPDDYITVNNIVVSYEQLGNAEEAHSWRIKLSRLRRPW
jgi:tetratricopeptide (TPR) repeat protein